jgi:hypothetical protein
MRHVFHRALFAYAALAASSAWGQMHKVAKPEQVVRAVGVYEWTGDMAKPTASRLIPVSVFIDGKLEDAGVYVSRPVPFALLSGNVYELQDAGIDKAMLDLAYARHLRAVDATGDLAYDDGWFGYGSVKPLAVARRPAKLKPSKTLPVLTTSSGSSSDANRPHLDGKTAGGGSDQSKTTTGSTSTASSDDSDRPTMKRRSSGDSTSDAGSTPASSGSTSTAGTASSGSNGSAGSTGSTTSTTGAGSTSSDDPDRPTMKRRSDSTSTSGDGSTTSTAPSTGSNTTGGTAPADDPDRPTMKRRSDSTTSSSDGSTTTAPSTGGSATPADDPDRPTMKRRSSDSTSGSASTSTASTSGGATPADDPDRPTLKRHTAEETKKARNGGNDSAMATGGSLNDDPNRPNLHHGKPTSAMTEDDLPKLVGLPADLHQMVAVSDAKDRDPHEFALTFDDPTQRAAVLQKMQSMARAQLAAYGKQAASPKAAPPTAKKTPTSKSRKAAPAPATEMLMEEQLKSYTLSYGGAATYVYTAHTAGTGAALRYVTIVAQADGLGELKPAIQSVTDAAHLDQTPRMRFVDVVDAEASNRASLLFELRGQSSRQFGLYRVIASHSEQIFLTGTTQ